MSAHIRTVLERSYQQNANTKKLDLVMISFCDQAEDVVSERMIFLPIYFGYILFLRISSQFHVI